MEERGVEREVLRESEYYESLLYAMWKEFVIEDCLKCCLSRSFFSDCLIRASLQFLDDSWDFIRKIEKQSISTFTLERPIFCRKCECSYLGKCKCETEIESGKKCANFRCFRVVLQVTTNPLHGNVEKIYLRKLTPATKGFSTILALSRKLDIFSAQMTDGDQNLYVNFEGDVFRDLVFHAGCRVDLCNRNPMQPLAGALLLLTLHEQDACGVVCRNLTRERTRQQTYSETFHAMSFHATDVKFICWQKFTPLLPVFHHAMDLDEIWDSVPDDDGYLTEEYQG